MGTSATAGMPCATGITAQITSAGISASAGAIM